MLTDAFHNYCLNTGKQATRLFASVGDDFKRTARLRKWLQRNLVTMARLSISAFMSQDSIRVGLNHCATENVSSHAGKQSSDDSEAFLLFILLFFFFLRQKQGVNETQ